MSLNKSIIIAVVAGIGIGVVMTAMFSPTNDHAAVISESDEKKPLYWVAPMDANYRRDKPGKSPMGMDLVPVYEESSSSDQFGEGAVKIAPNVINNLGVRTAQVEVKNMQSEISTVGYVQYNEDNLIHIHPRVDGWIEKLYVTAAGNPVKKGQPLYTLYSPQLVNAQEEFLIALKRNNQSLIDAAKERLAALQLSNDFIEELEKSGVVKQTVTFYSPQNGVVDGLKVREGFYVKPGNTLLSIGQLENVWVEAEVFERDTALIKQGLPVTMTLNYLPGEIRNGVVDYVYPTLNMSTRTVRVRLKFDNPQLKLKPNMFAQVTIYAEQNEANILVPKEAVIRTGKQDRVVVDLGDGYFKSVAVKIGRVNSQYIEIIEGLSEDDRVVTSAHFLIDSESSKSSDFKRMTYEQEPKAVWMEGEVNEVMQESNTVNITHAAVEAWQWPEMTMDFELSDTVDINALKAGQSLHFEVTKLDNGSYLLTAIHIMSEPEVSKATVTGLINAIDHETNVLNISRGPIEKWGRPAATMDFVAAESIKLSDFKAGNNVLFTFEIREEFIITSMSLVEDEQQNDVVHAEH